LVAVGVASCCSGFILGRFGVEKVVLVVLGLFDEEDRSLLVGKIRLELVYRCSGFFAKSFRGKSWLKSRAGSWESFS
jgi:hypothetical protein